MRKTVESGGRRTLGVCAEGCYKHFVSGKWVCCKCGK